MLKEFKRTFLYLKTHNITGLKYFGKTIRDPHKYRGSGKYWSRHLSVHGYDCSTEIIGIFENRDECMHAAMEYSKKYDIVDNPEFANLMLENGEDGADSESMSGEKNPFWGKKHSDETKRKISEQMQGKYKGINNPMYGKTHTAEAKRKIIEKNTGKKRSAETKKKISEAMCGKNHPFYGKKHSEDTIKKMRKKRRLDRCTYCGVEYAVHIISRWHNENCKTQKLYHQADQGEEKLRKAEVGKS